MRRRILRAVATTLFTMAGSAIAVWLISRFGYYGLALCVLIALMLTVIAEVLDASETP